MSSTELHQIVVIPTEHADEVKNILQAAVDQLAILSIPVQASEIEERCVDTPIAWD